MNDNEVSDIVEALNELKEALLLFQEYTEKNNDKAECSWCGKWVSRDFECNPAHCLHEEPCIKLVVDNT